MAAVALALMAVMAAMDAPAQTASVTASVEPSTTRAPTTETSKAQITSVAGIEDVSCATWLDWRRRDGAIKLFFSPVGDATTATATATATGTATATATGATRVPGWDQLASGAWRLGYGKDPSAHDDANMLNEVKRAGLNAWIDGYCRRHQRHDLARAAGGLAHHLSRQR